MAWSDFVARVAQLTPSNSDAQIVATLNARDRRGPVSIRDLSSVCLKFKLTAKLEFNMLRLASKQATLTADEQALGETCSTALTLIRDDYRLAEADIDDADFQAALAAFQSLGWLTADQVAYITAMAANRVSESEQLLGRQCSENDVGRARNGG